MKKYITLALFVTAILTTSCKKECDCPEKDEATTTEMTESTNGTTTADESLFNKDVPTTGSSATTQTQSTTTKRSVKRTTAKSQNYLSDPAPDGTDAENHDGDYYTRNDTNRMPTGTPIK